ncbi:DUF4384 domain-containing protein [Roseofilum casamattae]|uniref:DUF4384 domain-containing protein n=1 Tax=Roseofilum casamattae BLCC-M143 TaxID=3022442 RepID=A0ABT7BVD2_9CYAN|nr:DUF4384 domain-containing protein [Roseofilum casamattae]MDJ1183150.1 DUF4384 domain-containing protein [Roseofilum casamattae BLCC-M143]
MESLGAMEKQAVAIAQHYETPFLESMAAELGLSPTARGVFVTRLLQKNLKKQWKELVAALPNGIDYGYAHRNVWSKEIIEALHQQQFSLPKNIKKGWLNVREWLEQGKYQSWLWQMLMQQAQLTQQMGFLEVLDRLPVSHLGARHQPARPYVKAVKLGSEVVLEMTVADPVHLTLLEQEPNGAVVCLCPSEYARESQLAVGNHQLPQETAPYRTFAATEVGKERWLALLTPEQPQFPWLDRSRAEALELRPEQLQDVLDYAIAGHKGRLLYTEYEVC